MLEDAGALIEQALPLVKESRPRECLSKALGIIETLLDDVCKWDRIQRAYEAGARPVDLSVRFCVPTNSINCRAHKFSWMNPRKLAKIASIKKNKNVMHIVCQRCEQYFETTSGHAKVCPTCKALENMGRQA